MDSLALHSLSTEFGEVFTPIEWAKWLLRKFDVVDQWLAGKTVADPTGGNGAFILALCDVALELGLTITDSDLQRLYIIDRNKDFLDTFASTFEKQFKRNFPAQNIVCADLILDRPQLKVDILIGNPPWVNFADLTPDYKEELKPYFIEWGLIPDARRLLLGGSRVDLSALILQVCLGSLLSNKGFGVFIIPLSLFFGDEAHSGFRSYTANGRGFAVEGIWDLKDENVFDGIATSYGFALFRADTNQAFPIPYFKGKRDHWTALSAHFLRNSSDPLRITNPNDTTSHTIFSFSLSVSHEQSPRQGVNTCGTNDVFLFDAQPQFIPEQYLCPLVTREVFRRDNPIPSRWVFLPYNRDTGRIAEQSDLEANHELWTYLSTHRAKLEARKGTMLAATMRRGYWWALLGVGPYCFAPFKVIWEAYGSKNFRPLVLSSFEKRLWQANQAMHAFIPSSTLADANRICDALREPEFQLVLTQMNGGGKCNWAQPGKIRKLISFRESIAPSRQEPQLSLF